MSDSATVKTASRQASLSITSSRSLLKLMSIESMMPSNHLILCRPLLLLLSIFPSIRVFSVEPVLCIRWPKYWWLSFSISPSDEYSVLISFRIDWFDLLAVQGTLKSLLQLHSSEASILQHSAFFMVQLSYLYMITGKTIALIIRWAFLGKVIMNKASGGDGIPDELFQILKDDAVKVLHSICQQIWKTQQWPHDWKRSVFIPVSKTGNAKECSNHHTIALISHASKVMLKILQSRLERYVNCKLSGVQAGFRKGGGTKDQIANVRWIIEKARELQKSIYFCFNDYAKTFDCVDHNKLWKILKEMGIPDHLTCLLRNLYEGQEAAVRTGHVTTD